MPKVNKKSKAIILFFIIILSAAAAYFAVNVFFKTTNIASLIGLKPNMQKIIADMAEELNKNYPKMVDDVTRIDKIIPEEGNAFTYSMTITADISLKDIDIPRLQDNIKNNYCLEQSMQALRKAGTKISWSYHNASGQYLTTITMTPESCK